MDAQRGSEPDVAKYEDDEVVDEEDEVESVRIISVLAETNRRDRWTIAPNTSMFTVLARSHFDFRKVEAEGDTVEIDIICVCGHITLVVPEGTKVQLSGFSFLASANSDVADPDDESGSPLPKLIVNATTVFGKLSIRTPNETDLAPALDAAADGAVANGQAPVGAVEPDDATAGTVWGEAEPAPTDDAVAAPSERVDEPVAADTAGGAEHDATRATETVGAA